MHCLKGATGRGKVKGQSLADPGLATGGFRADLLRTSAAQGNQNTAKRTGALHSASEEKRIPSMPHLKPSSGGESVGAHLSMRWRETRSSL